MLKKETIAVLIALITGIAGVTTAFINRMSPAEPVAEATYEVTKQNFDTLVDDLDAMETHLDDIEHKILRQCLRRIKTSKVTAPTSGDDDPLKIKRPRRLRKKMPPFDRAQQQRP